VLGFEGDGDDLGDEAEDVVGVVGTVGVVDDAGAGVGGDAVLVDDPIEGGAVAEAVVECSGGDAAKEKEVVVAEFGFVFGELTQRASLRTRLPLARRGLVALRGQELVGASSVRHPPLAARLYL
jgi:hypothetical protein